MATTSQTTTFPSIERPATGMGWRISVSVAAVFAWLIFLLLYFAFWAGAYSAGQSAVIVVVSLLAFVGVNAVAWASWGARHRAPR
jgi:hypothetical protein